MKSNHINVYLIATILTLSVSSFFASYILLNEILSSALNIGVNEQTKDLFTSYQKDLKILRELDPENHQIYRKQFYKVQESMIIYENPTKLNSLVKRSYLTYFIIIFIAVLIVSIIVSFFISRQISNAYKKLMHQNIDNLKRINELEHFDSWQRIAANLAHEVKNPLTPIEMMVSSLNQSYQSTSKIEFERKLDLTEKIVLSEVSRLKDMVNHFSQFSKLPESQLKEECFYPYVQRTLLELKSAWNSLVFEESILEADKQLMVNLDESLFKQCLLNLVKNVIESNQHLDSHKIHISIMKSSENQLVFTFSNLGVSLNHEQREQIFQIGYSGKNNQHNRGLGLSIVKKIILEHCGKITSIPFDRGVSFQITLPIINIRL